MAVKIQFRRGNFADLPTLSAGEPGFCSDTKQFFVGDGSSNHELALKSYVDAVAQGLKVLDAVAAATTGPVTLANEQTVDGVGLVAGNRVLVKDQADSVQNGVYIVVDEGAWERASDLLAASDAGGSFVFVSGGTTHASTGWVCTNEPEADTVGTNELTFAQFSFAGFIEAGAGLVKVGNVLGTTGVLEDLAALAPPATGQFIQGSGAGTFQYLTPANTLAALSGVAGADFSMNSKKITNLADPANDQDAATKKWVSDNFAAGSITFVSLTDTPANFTNAANKIVRVNGDADALEFVAFGTTYLEDSPTENLQTKAPTSKWAYTHAAATTNVHGAGDNTLLHSGSTIDGGTFV